MTFKVGDRIKFLPDIGKIQDVLEVIEIGKSGMYTEIVIPVHRVIGHRVWIGEHEFNLLKKMSNHKTSFAWGRHA